MLCLTIEVPSLPFEEQCLQILSPVPLRVPDVPFDVPLSKTYPGSFSKQKSTRRSCSYEAAAASSLRNSVEIESDTRPSSRAKTTASTPGMKRDVFGGASSRQHEDYPELLPVSPSTPRNATQACSEVPAIIFEGPCFHGLPCPPAPRSKTERSPLTRRRATVPLIQPSSPVLARRSCSHDTPEKRRETLSWNPDRKITAGELSLEEVPAEPTGEERLHRRTLTYPRPSETSPFSHFDTVSRRAPEYPVVDKRGFHTPVFSRQPISPSPPRAPAKGSDVRSPTVRKKKLLRSAVLREPSSPATPRSSADGKDLELSAFFLPSASVSMTFDSPRPRR